MIFVNTHIILKIKTNFWNENKKKTWNFCSGGIYWIINNMTHWLWLRRTRPYGLGLFMVDSLFLISVNLPVLFGIGSSSDDHLRMRWWRWSRVGKYSWLTRDSSIGLIRQHGRFEIFFFLPILFNHRHFTLQIELKLNGAPDICVLLEVILLNGHCLLLIQQYEQIVGITVARFNKSHFLQVCTHLQFNRIFVGIAFSPEQLNNKMHKQRCGKRNVEKEEFLVERIDEVDDDGVFCGIAWYRTEMPISEYLSRWQMLVLQVIGEILLQAIPIAPGMR